MLKLRTALLTFAVFALGCVLCAIPSSPAADKPTDKAPSDSTTPLAEEIKPLEVELNIGEQMLTTTLLYSRNNATLFAFPVWVIKGDLRVNTRKDAEYRVYSADDPFFKDGEPPLTLQVGIDDLLAHEKTRKVVHERLWQEFPVAGGKGDRSPLERPFLYKDAYSVTLFTPSTGRNGLPKEMPISLPASPSEVVLKGNAPLYLELLPANMAIVAADRGKPLLVRECFLRVTGSMKARFEDTQCEANFEVVRSEVTKLQHRLSSLTPSRETPEAFVQVPNGGSVGGDTSVFSLMSAQIVASISIREGATAKDYAAILELAKSFLEPQVKAISLTDDNKRVAVMMSNNATLSATVGDIKKLAKQTKEEREKQLSTALEEAEKRRNGQESDYKGSLGLDVSTGVESRWLGAVNTRVAGQVSGEMKKKIDEEQAKARKQQMASLNRDLDELGKCFEGSVPTLTGISFDQKGLDEAVKNVKGKIDLKKFTVGPSQVNWSEVYLGSSGPDLLSAKYLADELARTRLEYKELHDRHEAFLKTNAKVLAEEVAKTRLQYDELRQQHEALRKTISSVERFAELEKKAQEAHDLAERLKKSLDRIDKLEKLVAGLTPDEIVAEIKKVAGIDLIAIPGQKENEFFFMGSENDDKDAFGDEKPRHKVRISKPFYLGETKVTVGQFKRFVDATGYKTEAEKAGDTSTWKSPGFEQTDEHPVVYVSWNDAKAYCDWLDSLIGGKGKVRLPREAEREYSCRANTTTKFSFGDDTDKLGDYAWFDGDREGKNTRPVRQQKPNDFKLYDMHGLAWEWCWDGKREYPKEDSVFTDPEGPTGTGVSRVMRGGSYFDGLRFCRSACRFVRSPSDRFVDIGFRLFVSR